MAEPYVIPGVYEHYKGKKYFVLGLSKNTETGEVCVVYRPLYETGWPQLVHRNADMFFEQVTIDGRQVPRFKLLASNCLLQTACFKLLASNCLLQTEPHLT